MVDNTLLVSEEYELYDAFHEAVQGWTLDFRQLSRPEGNFFLEQITGCQLFVSRALLPASFHQRGVAPPGCRTVSFLAHGSPAASWRWCGESVSHNSLIVMPVGGEFESMSTPGLDSWHLTLPISLLEEVSQVQFQLPLQELMPDDRCFSPNCGPQINQLRDMVRRFRQKIFVGNNPRKAFDIACIEQELARLVLTCLAHGRAETPGENRSKRMRILDHALEQILEHHEENIGVTELVQSTGVSRRTLENAFCDGLGIGPAAYLKALKLNNFHRHLLNADRRRSSVAALAEQSDFNHLGQLAADYQQMFGELPLATLQRQPH